MRWVGSILGDMARGDKKLYWALAVVLVINFIGVGILGAVDYNLTKFDMLPHFFTGFFARELMARANESYPFVDKIRDKSPRRLKKYITLTSLCFVLCMAIELREELMKRLPGLGAIVYTDLWDQVKDAVMDTLGITVSIYKGALRKVLLRLKPASP